MSGDQRYLLAKAASTSTSTPPRPSLVSSGIEQRLELTFVTRPCNLPDNTSDLAFVAVDLISTLEPVHWVPIHIRISDDCPTHKSDFDNVAVPSLGLLMALDLVSHKGGCSVLVRAPDALRIPRARLVRYERVSGSSSAVERDSAADGDLIRAVLAGHVVCGEFIVNVGSQRFRIVDALADILDDDKNTRVQGGGKNTRQAVVTSAFTVPAISTASNRQALDDVISFVYYEPDNSDDDMNIRGIYTMKSNMPSGLTLKDETEQEWPPFEAQVWAERASQALGGVCLTACRRLTDWMSDINSGGTGHLGAVVWGLPGAGKRSLLKAVAHSAGLSVLELDPRDAFCEQIGAGEEHISEMLLNRAVLMSPCVVLINSVELLAPPVHARGNAEQRLCAVLMSALDSLAAGAARVLVVGTTSRRDDVDAELLTGSRLSLDVPMPPPTPGERVKILSALLSPITFTTDGGVIESDKKEIIVADIARRANGFVRADLEGLVREAYMWDRQQHKAQENQASNCLSAEALLNGLNAVQPHTMRAIGKKEVGADNHNEVDTGLSIVAGLHTARAQMLEAVVMPLRHSVVLSKRGVGAPKGVLFYGPSGNGKTALSRELQRMLKHEGLANFVSVPCSSLISKQVGGSEAAVVDAFARARCAAPCVLFLDQIEAIAPRRGFDSSSGQTFDRILSCLLTEMDGILNKDDLTGVYHPPVILVAATDKVEALDAAILRPGRFDQIIKIDRPNSLERADLIDHFLAHTPVVNISGSDSVLPQIVAMTVGWSAAELEGVCRESVLECLRRDIECEALDISLLLDAVVAVCEGA